MRRLLLALPLAGCWTPSCPTQTCTDAVLVTIADEAGNPIEHYYAWADLGDGPARYIDCSGDSSAADDACSGNVLQLATSLPSFHLKVEDVDGTMSWSGDLAPDYEDLYLNGETCGVSCIQAEARIRLQPGVLGDDTGG